jgi:hypothetical protein
VFNFAKKESGVRILFILGVLYFFSFAAQAAVDYSRCQAYVHPEGMLGTPQRMGTGGFGVPFPFKIKADGTLEKKDFADLRTEDGGKTQIFSITLPGYNGYTVDGAKLVTPDSTVEYTVRRDDKGRIIEISNGPKMTNSQLKQMHQIQIDYYNENVPEEVRKRNDQMMGEGKTFEPPFVAHKGQTLTFDYRGDKCFPNQAKMESYLEPKVDGKSSSTTTLDTPLCRDINEFIKANPEASACFRKDINERMGMIFKKHAPKYENETNQMMGYGLGFGGFGSYGGGFSGIGGLGMMGGMAYQSIASNVMLSNPEWTKNLNDQGYLENARRFGSSPVMNGQRILQNCFDVGIRDVIEDEELWAKVNSTGASTGSETSAEER